MFIQWHCCCNCPLWSFSGIIVMHRHLLILCPLSLFINIVVAQWHLLIFCPLWLFIGIIVMHCQLLIQLSPELIIVHNNQKESWNTDTINCVIHISCIQFWKGVVEILSALLLRIPQCMCFKTCVSNMPPRVRIRIRIRMHLLARRNFFHTWW